MFIENRLMGYQQPRRGGTVGELLYGGRPQKNMSPLRGLGTSRGRFFYKHATPTELVTAHIDLYTDS